MAPQCKGRDHGDMVRSAAGPDTRTQESQWAGAEFWECPVCHQRAAVPPKAEEKS